MTSLILSLVAFTTPTLSIRVEGDGYLRFAKGSLTVYAKQSKLVATQKGLADSDGSLLLPRIACPLDIKSLSVSLDGTVVANGKNVGQIVLGLFPANATETSFGKFVRFPIKPKLSIPGDGIAGVVRPWVSGPTPNRTAPQVFRSTENDKCSIKVNSKSEIIGEEILLQDIAEISGNTPDTEQIKKVSFGKAPLPGATRTLSTTYVRAAIIAAGFNAYKFNVSVPINATVERKSQRIPLQKIHEAVSGYIEKKMNFVPDLEMKNRISDPAVIAGDYALSVVETEFKTGQMVATIDVLVNGEQATQLALTYKVANLVQIKRGEVVRLRMISNSAKVEVSAKAKTEGYIGQRITVETDSGASQTGTLIGPGLVEVRL